MPRAYYAKGTLVLEWLALSAVRYDLEHMEYLLPLLPMLRQGLYLPEPSGEAPGARAPGHRAAAPYERACQVSAEVDRRLAMCHNSLGSDRPYLEEHYCNGLTLRQLRLKYGLSERNIKSRIRSALTYISSGPCPRWLACEECGKNGECRREKKGRRTMTYTEWRRSRSYSGDYLAHHQPPGTVRVRGNG